MPSTKRKISTVYRDLDLNPASTKQWAHKYSWTDRAKAFERHIADAQFSKIVEGAVEGVEHLSQKRLEIAKRALELVAIEMERLEHKIWEGGKADPVLSVSELTRLWKLAADSTRLEVGEATQRTENVEVQGPVVRLPHPDDLKIGQVEPGEEKVH